MENKGSRSPGGGGLYEFKDKNPLLYFSEGASDRDEEIIEGSLGRFSEIKENIEKGKFGERDLYLIKSILTLNKGKFGYHKLSKIVEDILIKIELTDIGRYA